MDKSQKDLLVFGYGLGVIAAFFAIAGTLKHGFGPAQAVLSACAVVFSVVTACRWEALRPGYAGWMKVAHLIGGVVTTVIDSGSFILFGNTGTEGMLRVTDLKPGAKVKVIVDTVDTVEGKIGLSLAEKPQIPTQWRFSAPVRKKEKRGRK